VKLPQTTDFAWEGIINSTPSRFTTSISRILPFELPHTMISRSAIGRPAQLALKRGSCAQQRRGLAAAVSGSTSFSYQSSDVNGVKVASRDVAGATTKLAIVAKAGTRYQPAPGLTAGLEQFAFKVRLQYDVREFLS
jgi:hypothetical protein